MVTQCNCCRVQISLRIARRTAAFCSHIESRLQALKLELHFRIFCVHLLLNEHAVGLQQIHWPLYLDMSSLRDGCLAYCTTIVQ